MSMGGDRKSSYSLYVVIWNVDMIYGLHHYMILYMCMMYI